MKNFVGFTSILGGAFLFAGSANAHTHEFYKTCSNDALGVIIKFESDPDVGRETVRAGLGILHPGCNIGDVPDYLPENVPVEETTTEQTLADHLLAYKAAQVLAEPAEKAARSTVVGKVYEELFE